MSENDSLLEQKQVTSSENQYKYRDRSIEVCNF